MKTEEELKSSARLLIDEDGKEVLVKMNKIVKALQERDMSDWQIPVVSDAIMDLASLMINLGQMTARARLNLETAEEIKKENTRGRFLKEKDDSKTDATAKAIAEQAASEYEEDERVRRYMFGWLQNFYNDIERLISVSQSRMKAIKSDEVRSSI